MVITKYELICDTCKRWLTLPGSNREAWPTTVEGLRALAKDQGWVIDSDTATCPVCRQRQHAEAMRKAAAQESEA